MALGQAGQENSWSMWMAIKKRSLLLRTAKIGH